VCGRAQIDASNTGRPAPNTGGGVRSRYRDQFRRGNGIWFMYTRTISHNRRPAPSAGDPRALPCAPDLSIFLTLVKSRINVRSRGKSNRLIRLYNTNSFVGFGFARTIFAIFPARAHSIAALHHRVRSALDDCARTSRLPWFCASDTTRSGENG